MGAGFTKYRCREARGFERESVPEESTRGIGEVTLAPPRTEPQRLHKSRELELPRLTVSDVVGIVWVDHLRKLIFSATTAVRSVKVDPFFGC